jgi:magnesium transporter
MKIMDNLIVKDFLHQYPNECAREIENFSLAEILFFFEQLSAKEIAKILSCIMPSVAAICLESFPLKTSASVIVHIPVASLQAILPRVKMPLHQTLIQALSRNDQIALAHAMHFSMNTVGAYMTTHVLLIPSEHTVQEALSLMQHFPDEITSWIFCIDSHGKLQGMISFKDLLTTPHETIISHILQSCPLVLPASTNISAILTHSIWNQYSVLPIIDENAIVIGVLAYEKIIAQIQNDLFNQRQESLAESIAHIMQLLSHTTEDILNELNHVTSPKDQ